MRCFVPCLATVVAACWLGSTPIVGDEPAAITVDATRVVGRLNPWIFGSNMIGYQKSAWQHAEPNYTDRGAGIWDPERRRSEPAMEALAKNAGLSVSRYPGGCAVHRFDWKKTVGPVADRPDQRFGLPEFLQNCRDLGADPLVTLSDYQGTAQDAADLVEYLNGPQDGKGRWAAMRVADGHASPWNVVWFEYGNETEHGDHQQQKMSAQEYGRRYLAYRRAMRAVDPKVKLGAVIATGFPKLDSWARPVLEIIGKEVDFVIHHSYIPGYDRNDGKPDARTLFKIALAGADQIQDYYQEMNRLLDETAANRHVPIAVTEYNGSFVQERPVPYRHCLGNALVNAEMLRVFSRPENHIAMANFWQFANEYWGAVKGYPHKRERLVKRPQYFPFEFYHCHFARELLSATVACATYETEGGYGVMQARGKGTQYQVVPQTIPLDGPWQIGAADGVTQRVEGDTLIVDFQEGKDVNFFHASKRITAEPGTGNRLTGWIKTEGLTSTSGACFQVGDARGWPQTHSAVNSPNFTGTTDWTRVQVDYVTLRDTKEISILARRISGTGPVRGKACFRDLRLQKFIPKVFPAVPYLAVNASRNPDGTRVYLMVVNKNLDEAIKAELRFKGFEPRTGRAWSLVGSSVDTTNEQDPNAAHVVERNLTNPGLRLDFPPHSLTAVEVEGIRAK